VLLLLMGSPHLLMLHMLMLMLHHLHLSRTPLCARCLRALRLGLIQRIKFRSLCLRSGERRGGVLVVDNVRTVFQRDIRLLSGPGVENNFGLAAVRGAVTVMDWVTLWEREQEVWKQTRITNHESRMSDYLDLLQFIDRTAEDATSLSCWRHC
jgi:hypothetical protein